jgi:hypothetical protein
MRRDTPKDRNAGPVWCSGLFGQLPTCGVESARTNSLAHPDSAGGTPRIIPNLFAIGPAFYTTRRWQPHQQGRLPSRRQICFAAQSRLAVLSRASTPEGSRPAFGWGNVATPIRPVTKRPSLPPSSFTRCPVRSPCGSPSEACPGEQRAYHVASRQLAWVRSRLYAGGSSSAPGEFGAPGPGHAPFGRSLSAPWARSRDDA